MKFIVALGASEESFTAICRRFGISRETGYKWKRRFEAEGPRALEDRAPIAQQHPNATAVEVEDVVVALRKLHPQWGPKKLKRSLARTHPELEVPALSTVGRILDRRGMIAPRKRRLKVPPSSTGLSTPEHPNELWTTDHKGDFDLAEGRCYPLTLRDDLSRYLLKCEVGRSTAVDETWPHFEAAFDEFGLPKRIRSDNGTPFASRAIGGLSKLSVWWIKLGIEIERTAPGHPEQNGGHERMHRTLKAEAVQARDCSFAEQQRCFDRFRRYFNHERPHEGIEMDLPAHRYQTSWRRYSPEALSSPEYGPEMEVRRISWKGSCRWRKHSFYTSTLLIGEPVGFKEIDEGRWLMYFGNLALAGLELRSNELEVVRDVGEFMARIKVDQPL